MHVHPCWLGSPRCLFGTLSALLHLLIMSATSARISLEPLCNVLFLFPYTTLFRSPLWPTFQAAHSLPIPPPRPPSPLNIGEGGTATPERKLVAAHRKREGGHCRCSVKRLKVFPVPGCLLVSVCENIFIPAVLSARGQRLLTCSQRAPVSPHFNYSNYLNIHNVIFPFSFYVYVCKTRGLCDCFEHFSLFVLQGMLCTSSLHF